METADITSGEIASEFHAQAAAASPAPQQDTTTDTPEASPRETPAVRPTPVEEVTRIPLPDHERIVDGFHKRLDEVAWAKGLERERVQRALQLMEQHERQQAERQNKIPPPDAEDEKGERFYSIEAATQMAERMAAKIVDERMKEWEERFSPIESTFQEHQIFAEYSQQIDEVAQLPGAADYINEMADYVRDINDRRERGERIPKATAIAAYLAVVPKRLQEKGTASEADIRKRLLKEINDTTERVKDDVNPSRTPAASRKTYTTFADGLREELASSSQ